MAISSHLRCSSKVVRNLLLIPHSQEMLLVVFHPLVPALLLPCSLAHLPLYTCSLCSVSLDHTRPHIDHTGSFLAVCPSLCVTGLPWCYLVGSLPLPDADVSTPLAVRSGGEKRGGEMGWAGLQSVERRGRGGLSPPHTSCANSILCVAVRD